MTSIVLIKYVNLIDHRAGNNYPYCMEDIAQLF